MNEQPLTIQVEATLPDIDTLFWEWTLNGEWLGEESDLTLAACGPSGDLTLTVLDSTHYVRSDPTELLTDTLQWALDRPECSTTDSGDPGDPADPSISDQKIERCGCGHPASSASFAAHSLAMATAAAIE